MSKKKISLLIVSLNFPLLNTQQFLDEGGGGAENQLMLLVKNLLKTDKYHVYILSKRFRFKEKSQIILKNLNLIRIYAPNKFFLFTFYISSLLNILRIHHKKRIDIIQLNTPSISLPLVYFIKRLLKIPVLQRIPSVYTKSLMSAGYYSLAQPFFLRLIKKFEKLQCLNSEIYHEALTLGFNSQNLVKIPNGINPEPYFSIIRKSHKPIKKLLFIGRLVEEKGITLLIEAFDQISHEFPNLQLSLFGRGPELVKITQLIKRLNLEPKISISSFSSEDEKIKILQEHDLFILPSYFEGISNALLEALCSGMPVIVSNIRSNVEFIKDGINGLVFKSGNKNALKAKIRYSLEHSEKLWAIGEKGKLFCKETFNINTIQKQISHLYLNLINKGRESQ